MFVLVITAKRRTVLTVKHTIPNSVYTATKTSTLILKNIRVSKINASLVIAIIQFLGLPGTCNVKHGTMKKLLEPELHYLGTISASMMVKDIFGAVLVQITQN